MQSQYITDLLSSVMKTYVLYLHSCGGSSLKEDIYNALVSLPDAR